jgi:hypothetical protein
MAKILLESLAFNKVLYWDDLTDVFTYSEGTVNIQSVSFHLSEIVGAEISKDTKEGMINRLNNTQIYYVLVKLSNNNIITIPCKHLIQATGLSNNFNDLIKIVKDNTTTIPNPTQFERYEKRTAGDEYTVGQRIQITIVMFVILAVLFTACGGTL